MEVTNISFSGFNHQMVILRSATFINTYCVITHVKMSAIKFRKNRQFIYVGLITQNKLIKALPPRMAT
jgi:hypothetical protein